MPSPSAPLRLALVTRRYPPLIGGAERMLAYLAAALAEESCHVTVFTSRLDPTLPRVEHVETTRGALEVRRLETSALRYVGTLRYMLELRRALAALRPDLAYVSMLKHDAFVTLALGKRLGFPVVLRPEGAGATGDIAWQGWGRFGPRIARRCRHADAVVAISDSVHAELVAAGYEASRIVDIPNGVPIPRATWGPRADWSRAPRAVFAGRLAPEKNLETLIRAWPLVQAAHPNATLTLIGEGPEREPLETLIAALGLSGAIQLPGFAPEVASQLRGFDLFILPSIEEGMSLALLEAVAAGIPIVASDIPGNRTLVVDSEHGRLAAPDSPDALARAILDQWQSYDQAVSMGQSARLHAERFSIVAVARAHIELFRSLIERRHTASR